jgi:O-antigen/teichoic acid export membrane protein
MTGAQRIVFNALASFSRSVFGMALGLFSSRWLLQALGPVDYGLMGVVGSLIMFITFFSHITAGASARFFAYSIGSGDLEETRRWFNTSLSLHVAIPLAVILVGLTLGEYAIVHYVNIPADRLWTARWVFRFSLVSAIWSMCATPYLGMYTAKQRIAERSIWDVVVSVANFFFYYGLTRYRGDKWLLCSAGIVLISVSVGVIQVVRAHLKFPECRIHFPYWWQRRRMRAVFAYSGWTVFGALGGLFRGQGTAILLNRYFNPLQHPQVNAAYGIGNQVTAYTQVMSSSLMNAFSPEITALEGRGERERMLRQSLRASRFATFLILLLAMPLMIETDYLLQLWLREPPPLAAIFCRLILAVCLIDNLTVGQMVAVAAKGQIAVYQVVLGTLLILTLPIAWGLLHLGLPPQSIGVAFIATVTLCSAGRVLGAMWLLDASPRKWLRGVLMPCLGVVLVSGFAGLIVKQLLGDAGLVRLVLVIAATSVMSLSLGWWLVLDLPAKSFVIVHLRKILRIKA